MAETGCLRDGHFQNLEVSGQFVSKVPVVALTVATTISTAQSGTVFTLDSAGGAYNVTLPTVASASGCVFKFICAEDTPTADITIKSNAANIKGVIHVQSDTNENNLVSVTGHTNVLFDTTCLIGDWIELVGNGTNYFVRGQGSVQGAFTVS